VIDHHLWRGKSGIAGELGHFVVDPHGQPCRCGRRGCLETIAGSDGILRTIREQGHPDVLDIDGASRLVQGGDETARRAFADAGAVFGLGLSWLTNLLDLELVIVHADPALLGSDAYVPAARRSFAEHSFHNVQERPELRFQGRDDFLGARSAGSMVFRLLPDRFAGAGDPWA
jgi:predicted NBD/HSP70 family sugar kinase